MHDESTQGFSCQQMLQSLSIYVDKDASALLCEEIERHLSTCTDCKVVVDTLQKTILLYQTLPQPEMPESLRARLYHKLNLDEFLSSSQPSAETTLKEHNK